MGRLVLMGPRAGSGPGCILVGEKEEGKPSRPSYHRSGPSDKACIGSCPRRGKADSGKGVSTLWCASDSGQKTQHQERRCGGYRSGLRVCEAPRENLDREGGWRTELRIKLWSPTVLLELTGCRHAWNLRTSLGMVIVACVFMCVWERDRWGMAEGSVGS